MSMSSIDLLYWKCCCTTPNLCENLVLRSRLRIKRQALKAQLAHQKTHGSLSQIPPGLLVEQSRHYLRHCTAQCRICVCVLILSCHLGLSFSLTDVPTDIDADEQEWSSILASMA